MVEYVALWFAFMLMGALNAKALSVSIVGAIGLTALYPDVGAGVALVVCGLVASVVAAFRS